MSFAVSMSIRTRTLARYGNPPGYAHRDFVHVQRATLRASFALRRLRALPRLLRALRHDSPSCTWLPTPSAASQLAARRGFAPLRAGTLRFDHILLDGVSFNYCLRDGKVRTDCRCHCRCLHPSLSLSLSLSSSKPSSG